MKQTILFSFFFFAFSFFSIAQSPYEFQKGQVYLEGGLGLQFNNTKSFNAPSVDTDINIYRGNFNTTLLFQRKPKFAIGGRISSSWNHRATSGAQQGKQSRSFVGLNFLLRKYYSFTPIKRLHFFGQPNFGISYSRNKSKANNTADTSIATNYTPLSLSLEFGAMFRILPRLAITKKVQVLNYRAIYSNSVRNGEKTRKTFEHSISSNTLISNLLSFQLVYFIKK